MPHLNCSAIVIVSGGEIDGDERHATIVVVFIREVHSSVNLKRIDL